MKFRELLISAIICLLLVFYISFIGDKFKIQEIKEGYGEKFEYIITSLCLSYIAAFIFYIFNVYIKEKKEQFIKREYISTNVISMVNFNSIFFYNIIKFNNTQDTFEYRKKYFLTKEQLLEILKIIENDEAKKRDVAIWYDLTYERTKKHLAEICNMRDSFDAELAIIVSRLSTSKVLNNSFENDLKQQKLNESITNLKDDLHAYFQDMLILQERYFRFLPILD
jgi:hypothetical protein